MLKWIILALLLLEAGLCLAAWWRQRRRRAIALSAAVAVAPVPSIRLSSRETQHVVVVEVAGDPAGDPNRRLLAEYLRDFRHQRKRRAVLHLAGPDEPSDAGLASLAEVVTSARAHSSHVFLCGLNESVRARLASVAPEVHFDLADSPEAAIAASQGYFQARFHTEQRQDVFVLHITGERFCEDDNDFLIEAMESALATGASKIVLCYGQRILHEGIVGALVQAAVRARKSNAVTRFVFLHQQPSQIWSFVKMESHFPSYPTVDEAVAGFSSLNTF